MIIGLVVCDITTQFNLSVYCFVTSIFVISLSQYFLPNFNMPILRIIVSWISCVVWTWFSFITLNSLVTIVALCISGFNMWIFIILVDHVDFDWLNFIKD